MRRSATPLPVVLTVGLTVLLTVLAGLVTAGPAAATAVTERAQRRLNSLGCNAGPVDGTFGDWTRSAVIRFQSRHSLGQSGRLDDTTRRRLYADSAKR